MRTSTSTPTHHVDDSFVACLSAKGYVRDGAINIAGAEWASLTVAGEIVCEHSSVDPALDTKDHGISLHVIWRAVQLLRNCAATIFVQACSRVSKLRSEFV